MNVIICCVPNVLVIFWINWCLSLGSMVSSRQSFDKSNEKILKLRSNNSDNKAEKLK